MALLVLGALELGLRLMLGPPPPPVVVHGGPDLGAPWFTVEGDTVTPRFQLDPAGRFARVPSGPRVAYLGGSSVHGGVQSLAVLDEFPAQVEKITGIQAVNLGQPGLDSHDLAEITAALGAWSFDAWVVMTGHNDLGNTVFQQRWAGRQGEAWTLRLLEHLQIFVRLRRALGTPLSAVRGDLRGHTGITPAQRDTAVRHLGTNLARIAWAARQADTPLVLVVPASNVMRRPIGRACETDPCAPRLWDQARELGSADPAEAARLYLQAVELDPSPLRVTPSAQALIRRVAASEGATLVDAPTMLPQHPSLGLPAGGQFADAVHLNRRGHASLAKGLAKAVGQVLGQGAD